MIDKVIVKNRERRAPFSFEIRDEHRIKGKRQQSASIKFGAVPGIERRHQPVGIPKQPFTHVLSRKFARWDELPERIGQIFQNGG